MRIVEINAVPYGSTGKIMFQIAGMVKTRDGEVLCGVGYTHIRSLREDCKIISGLFTKSVHIVMSKLTGKAGKFSYFATKRFLRKVKRLNPDIIHLHNLHGWYINLPMLFRYIKENDIRVIWTLHDCWSFTGQCPHFTMVNCDKWKDGCFKCPQYKNYPGTFIDRTEKMWKLKKEWFTGVKDLTIVTPSKWLAGLVEQSFLKEYPIKVINNGVDLSIFKPTESDFRKRYNICDKFMVLGVAFDWGKRKGLDVFIDLVDRLDKDKYKIVLVGTDESIRKDLPKEILAIDRTQSQVELAEIYSAADVFVNPTREDNFPTVNMESLACGIPVLTFETGGSPEMLDEKCGSVVKNEDIFALKKEIIRICEEKPYRKEDCIKRAREFNKDDKFKAYIDLIYEN